MILSFGGKRTGSSARVKKMAFVPPPAAPLCCLPIAGNDDPSPDLVREMGTSSDLVDRLNFNIGLEFQDEIHHRFHAPVHHPFPTPDGSFFLLTTFWWFLFRLTEESVALALQSCLGGRTSNFHVKFLSTNHFRFLVFSTEVGFQIYRKHRVITSSFDTYFTYGATVLHTGKKRSMIGKLSKRKSGPKFYLKHQKKRQQ
jgi:hypothetical protein